MARVPVSQGNRVATQPLGRERFQVSAPRSFVGPAMERFGQALGQAAEDFDQIAATYDEADALRIDNGFAAYERERLRTGENAYLNTHGFNAGEGMEGAVTDLKTTAENLLQGARSERARAMAKRALDRRLGVSETQIVEHATTQMTAARNEQSAARIEGALTDAVDSRGTEQFGVNLGIASMELQQMGSRLGWSVEKIAQKSERLTETAFSRTVLAIDAEDGEPTRALEFLDGVKELVGPEQEAKLRNMLTPRVDAAWADSVIASGELFTYLPEVDPLAPQPEGETEAAPNVAGDAGVVGAELSKASFSPAVVAGFLGNFEVEGGYGGARGDGGSASGIAQWRAERRTNFRRMFGKDPHEASKDEQARFVVWEMENPQAAGMTVAQRDAILAADTPEEAAELIDRYYERSSGEHRGRRVEAARRLFSGAPGAPGVASDPRLNGSSMREAVDRYVAANPDVSERRKQALYAAADRSVANSRADRAQAEQDADRRVMEWLTQNKPGANDLTDIGQIPAAVLAGVSPSTLASLNSRVQATQSRIQAQRDAERAERAEEIEENAVFQLYSLTDEELATTDLRQYVGRLDQKTLGPWIDRQQRLQRGSAETRPVSSDRIASKVDQYGRPYGASRGPEASKEERQTWIKLREYVEQRVQGRANKDVGEEDLRAIIINGMEEVSLGSTSVLSQFVGENSLVGRSLNRTERRIDVPAGESFSIKIRRGVRQEIEAAFRARGIEPSARMVIDAYREGVARGVYEPVE